MWTLAIETTSAHPSLALLRDDAVTAQRTWEAQRTSTELFAALAGLLARAGIGTAAIGLIAVADGPGSFTGVRLGLTLAKGLIEVHGTPAAAVSTLHAIAATGIGPALAALDAGRNEVYFGAYPGNEEGLESLAAFRLRLAGRKGRAVTTQPSLQALCPDMKLVAPELAPSVGRLGLTEFHAGRILDALCLDARYMRRSDAELFAPAL